MRAEISGAPARDAQLQDALVFGIRSARRGAARRCWAFALVRLHEAQFNPSSRCCY